MHTPKGTSFVMEMVGFVMTCRDMTGHVLTSAIFRVHVLYLCDMHSGHVV